MTQNGRSWHKRLLDAFALNGIGFLPYLPDGVLAPLVSSAMDRPEFTVLPLTREEEGVGIAAGVNLAGGRSVLLMQVSGLGNSLNAIGSFVIAQRVPLLMLISERGGIGETVSTQLPFGNAAVRVMEATGISHHPLTGEYLEAAVSGAVDLAFVSRTAVALRITPQLSDKDSV